MPTWLRCWRPTLRGGDLEDTVAKTRTPAGGLGNKRAGPGEAADHGPESEAELSNVEGLVGQLVFSPDSVVAS